MGCSDFYDLANHIGHKIACVMYGSPDMIHNVAIECRTCNEVLMDFDRPDDASFCTKCGQFHCHCIKNSKLKRRP